MFILQYMQNHSLCAKYIFNRIGLPYDDSLPNQHELIFSQILIGSLFIRGYRIMVNNHEYECCILYKRNNFQTEYLYLKFFSSKKSLQQSKSQLGSILSSIKTIDKMKEQQQLNYRVILAFQKVKCFAELNKAEFNQYISSESQVELQVTDWDKQVQIDEQKMMVTSKEELTKLKDLVWTYINTFGNKYKNNYYCDLQKRKASSFNIQKLINTVNWIIYCETVDKAFNQIQTANWTCFEMRAKQKLKPDRKDILLTGSGRSMMIHLLLLEKMENYKKEYEKQVGEVICEFRKSYIEGQVKAYEISDELDSYNLIYKLKGFTIQKFNMI